MAIIEKQHRQQRTLVLAIGPPRAGLDTLTKAGVRCVKAIVVAYIRVVGGGGSSSGCRGLRHQGPAAVPGDPGRVAMMAAVVSMVSTGRNCQLRFHFSTPGVMGVRESGSRHAARPQGRAHPSR